MALTIGSVRIAEQPLTANTMKNKLDSFYQFIGRYGSLILAIMWSVLFALSIVVNSHDSRQASIYQIQLALAWYLIYKMEPKPVRTVTKA